MTTTKIKPLTKKQIAENEKQEAIANGLRDGWLRVDVDQHESSVPPYLNVVGYKPALATNGVTVLPRTMRFVHVMSRSAGGEIRGYALIDGRAYLRLPNYAGEWPELDTAVAVALGVEVVAS